MKRLLTIGIPTYNRAQLLDKQLNWLAQAIKGFEDDVEVLVSDNCSTDNTQEVIAKWKAQMGDIKFTSVRNAENIGVMKNIMSCLNSARTKYVWTIGDDDPIQNRAVSYTINKLKQYEDTSLLLLNFSGRSQITGEPIHPPGIAGNRWFDFESEDGTGDGKAVFQHCMTKSVGAVIFLTAIVYHTDLMQRASRAWPDGITNWMYLAYLAGYCAANGRTIVTKENFMECIVGVSYWQREPQASLLMQYKHIPEVVQKLAENGYSQKFYRAMMIQNFKEAKFRVFLGALRRWPAFTMRTIAPFVTSLSRAVFGAAPSHASKAQAING